MKCLMGIAPPMTCGFMCRRAVSGSGGRPDRGCATFGPLPSFQEVAVIWNGRWI